MQNQLSPIQHRTSSSSSIPKPLIDNEQPQNPTTTNKQLNNGSSSRQMFDLNEPCYISSEEEQQEVLKEKLISEDKHVLIKNKIHESSNNEVKEEEKKPIIREICTTSSSNNKKQKEYEVFVGGLDRDADEEDLMEVFKKVGEVVEVRLVKSKYSNKNKGFAFVRFASVELAKKAAAELNYTLIRGKVCEVTRNNDNETLHLGNICTSWTKDMLVDKLKSYELENLEQIDLIEDPNDSGRNRGYAFLSFSTHMDAVAACSKLHKGNPFFGKSVRADIAFAKSAVEPDDDVMAQVKSVFLDGLPDDWDENTVYEHLKKYGEIVNVTLAHSMPSAKRKDFGFINFSTREAALACIDGVNKDGVGDGANKLLFKASLRKPLRKRTSMLMGGWRGNTSRRSYERGFGSSYTSRSSRSLQSPSQDRDRRYVSRYSRREDDYEREASPPVERYSSQSRRGSVRQVPTQTHAPSRSREAYYEGRSSSRRSSVNYQDLSESYCQIPSRGRYVEEFYDPPLEYYEDDGVEEFDHPTPSRYKRPYAYEDDERLVSRPLTRNTRTRWSELEEDEYAEHDVSYDEYSRNMPDERIVYETRGRASQYVPRSRSSRSYYY